jgi:hypothetical protein
MNKNEYKPTLMNVVRGWSTLLSRILKVFLTDNSKNSNE